MGRLFAAAVVSLFLALVLSASPDSARELARAAGSDDRQAADIAIAELRAMEQRGIEALLSEFAVEIALYRDGGDRSPKWDRIARAIDSVAMQKDAYASGLYWFTDLEDAKAAASATGRPILSLRLLGRLDEEFSCANSRLFRSVLYSNTEISNYLRENYVLHWRSVRPAPRITIDFGDGRKIERTITGNSIHYILDETGMVIDALPGLYSPALFSRSILAARDLQKQIAGKSTGERHRLATNFRRSIFQDVRTGRDRALDEANISLDEPAAGTDAVSVAPIAVTKMIVTDEISLIRGYDDFARFAPQIDLSAWRSIAGIYAPETGLDDNAIRFIRRQNRDAGLSDQEFRALIRRLDEFLSIDSARNDILFRPQIFGWLSRPLLIDIESFNSRVYSEIFRTPDSDPWLGLYASDVYAALDGNGITK